MLFWLFLFISGLNVQLLTVILKILKWEQLHSCNSLETYCIWCIPGGNGMVWLTDLSSDLQAKFEFHHGDYEKQCLHALGRKDKAGMVMNNPTQSVFLFMDRQHLQVSYGSERCFTGLKMWNHTEVVDTNTTVLCSPHLQTPKTKATVFKLCSLCLYLPQDQLTCWGAGDIEDHLRPYMPD